MGLPQPLSPSDAERPAPALSEWIGFKWLMGVQGHRVDVQRLQCDSEYALTCLAQACGGRDPVLRAYAERLRQRLG